MNPFVLESSALVASAIALSGAGIAMIPRIPLNIKAARQQAAERRLWFARDGVSHCTGHHM